MEELKVSMEKQGDRIDEILWLLKGNKDLEITGVIPSLKTLTIEVHEIAEWRRQTIENKWKLDLKFALKFLGIVISGAGGIFTCFEILKQVFDHSVK